jgi:alkanesulfonate monooxygenase SsuD/methylene tetrahydromethanopterin reductase-like flavin-dependent oxidoreductase (luciferase family)
MDVGIVIMLEGTRAEAPRFAGLRDLALGAEGAGFDSLWLYDHLLFEGEGEPMGQWECLTVAAGLAAVTARARIGTLVACASFRNPALLAKQATALDEVSGGRFVLGLGAGWNRREFEAFGFPFERRVERFTEQLAVTVPLVKQGFVDFAGEHHRAERCVDLPRGPRPEGPPILIGAFGPRMLELAARHGDMVNTAYGAPSDRERLAAACAAAGRDPATLPVSSPLWVAFPDIGPTPPHMEGCHYREAAPVAEKLRELAEAGLAEVMVDLRPNTPAALERLAEALRRFREEV